MPDQLPSYNKKPKVLFFDVNETLLDLSSMLKNINKILGGGEETFSLWFTTMLHHSLVANSMDEYHEFGEIGVATLMMRPTKGESP